MDWAVAVLSIALAGSLYAIYQIHGAQKREILRLREIRRRIREEEKAMIDFLHILGKAVEKAVSGSNLHDLITRGVAKVLRADGGALYVLDKDAQRLVPSSYSTDCPPLVSLPERVLLQAKTNSGTILSYLRLHSVGLKESFLGRAYTAGHNERTEDLFPKQSHRLMLKEIAAMAAPLMYGGKKIGVLAVANNRNGRRFSPNDFALFSSIAEQSASALGSLIQREDAEANRRIEEDLRNAREIQRVLLPVTAHAIPGYEIHGINIPARTVSGDYFDYIPIDAENTGVVIGDVSGKGISASLLMAMCRTVLRVTSKGVVSPKEALSLANRLLFPDIREDKFISLAFLRLRSDSNEAVFARAGHDAPLYFKAETGTVSRLEAPGLALGIDQGAVFDRVVKDVPLRMADGDCILLYTDGVNEAMDRLGREFGMVRLERLFKENAARGAKEVVETVTKALKSFMGGFQQYDDITMVVVRRVATAQVPSE